MKQKVQLLAFTIALLTVADITAQSHIKIAGQAVTSTGEPAAFAHVLIKDKNMGGTTDQDGFFKYFIPEHYINDHVNITLIGFETYEVSVRDLVADPEQVLVLEEKVIELESVTVYAPNEIMRSATKSIVEVNDPGKFYSRSGIITLKRKEGEDYVLFEEIAFNFYHRGLLNDEPLLGFEPTAQRRSIDYSTFLYLLPRGGSRTFSAGPFFGIATESSVVEMAQNIDELELEITDIIEENGQQVYVITRRPESMGIINYYVDLDQNRLQKVEYISTSSEVSTYVGGSPFNNSKYNRFRYLFTHTYHFETVGDESLITKIEHITKTQYIERITGYLHRTYEDHFSINFFDYNPQSEQPPKHKDEFKLPLAIAYDPGFWQELEGKHGYTIDPTVVASMSNGKSLEEQFLETDGKVVRGSTSTSSTFKKSDQKRQAKIDDIDDFIGDLVNNQYDAGFPPELGWEDIPKLMEIASSQKIIDRFPRNILSRLYLKDCRVGIVALWLIDSIRKNEGKKVRKAWYVSPMPLLQDESDRNASKARGGGNEFIPSNSDEKLIKAHKAFELWWKNGQKMSRSKLKRVNPLEGSNLNWLWR